MRVHVKLDFRDDTVLSDATKPASRLKYTVFGVLLCLPHCFSYALFRWAEGLSFFPSHYDHGSTDPENHATRYIFLGSIIVSFLSTSWMFYFFCEAIDVFRFRFRMMKVFSDLTHAHNTGKRVKKVDIDGRKATDHDGWAETRSLFPSKQKWLNPLQVDMWLRLRVYCQTWRPRLMLNLNIVAGIMFLIELTLIITLVIEFIVGISHQEFFTQAVIDLVIVNIFLLVLLYHAAYITMEQRYQVALLKTYQYKLRMALLQMQDSVAHAQNEEDRKVLETDVRKLIVATGAGDALVDYLSENDIVPKVLGLTITWDFFYQYLTLIISAGSTAITVLSGAFRD